MLPSDFLDEPTSSVIARFYDICRARIDSNMCRYVSPERRISIGFCFVDNNSPGAFASRYSGEYSIILHSALIPLIFGFWQRAIERKEVNASIADVSDAGRLIYVSVDTIQSLWNAINLYRNDDPVSDCYFWEFVRFGIEYIVDHEFIHIVRGHLDYLGNAANVSILSDDVAAKRKLSRRKAKLLQAIEMDADNFASKMAVLEFMRRGSRAVDVTAKAVERIVYKDNMTHMLKMLFLSLYNMFRLFGSHREQISGMYFRGHPPSFIRFLRLTQIANETMNRFDMLAGKVDHPVDDIIFFEVSYCDITGLPFDKSIGEYYASKECLDYALSVLNELRKMRPYFSDPLQSPV